MKATGSCDAELKSKFGTLSMVLPTISSVLTHTLMNLLRLLPSNAVRPKSSEKISMSRKHCLKDEKV